MDIHNIPPSVWATLPREQQQQIMQQLADEVWQQQQQANKEWEEANKPPSETEEIVSAVGGMAALPAGYWLGQHLFGSGGAATTAATTPAAAGAAQTAAQSVAPAAAQTAGAGSAQGLAQIGSMASGAPMLGSSVAPAVASAPWYAAPAGSDAAALGSTIGSGLETLGMGAGTAGTAGSLLGSAASAAGGLYGGYQLYNNLSDNQKDPLGGAMAGAATGASIGSFIPVPGFGTLIGAGVGGLVGLGLGMVGGNKDKDQLKRDAVRARLKDNGILGNDYSLTRADGSAFNIGMDGDAMLKNAAGQERRYFDVDFNDPNAGSVVGAVDPLAAIISGGDEKLRNDYAGYFANFALGGGDANANIQRLYQQFGLDKDTAWSTINELESKGKIDQQMGHILRNGLNNVFGGNPVAAGQTKTPGQPQQLQQTIPTTKGQQLPLAGGKSRLLTGNKTPPAGSITPTQTPMQKPNYQSVAQALLQKQTGANPRNGSIAGRLQGLTAYAPEPTKDPQKEARRKVAWALTGL